MRTGSAHCNVFFGFSVGSNLSICFWHAIQHVLVNKLGAPDPIDHVGGVQTGDGKIGRK